MVGDFSFIPKLLHIVVICFRYCASDRIRDFGCNDCIVCLSLIILFSYVFVYMIACFDSQANDILFVKKMSFRYTRYSYVCTLYFIYTYYQVILHSPSSDRGWCRSENTPNDITIFNFTNWIKIFFNIFLIAAQWIESIWRSISVAWNVFNGLCRHSGAVEDSNVWLLTLISCYWY